MGIGTDSHHGAAFLVYTDEQRNRGSALIAVDRLDYFIYCLKEQGMYVYMDNLAMRKFKQADGVVNSLQLRDRAAPYCLYNRKLIELQKE